MAGQDDVRRIALALPEVVEEQDREPHHTGFPAVLVRLAAVDSDELRELITDAWRCQARPALVRDSGR